MKKTVSNLAESEVSRVEDSLCELFESAMDIYVDTDMKECEVTVSEGDFKGALDHDLEHGSFLFTMVDFSDIKPFKYVFGYRLR
jgi:hypothetical protein